MIHSYASAMNELKHKTNILTKAVEMRFQAIKHLQVMVFAEEYELRKLEEQPFLGKKEEMRRKELEESIGLKQIEIQALAAAAKQIENHPYAQVITGRYWEGKPDEMLATELCCDISTIRRNRKKLLSSMAMYLYDIKE